MKKKVFISGRIPRIAYEMLSEQFEVSMHDDVVPLPKERIMEGMKDHDALLSLLSDPIDAEVIDSNPRLKIIANYGAGFNNIHLETASSRKIPVTNTPIISTNATADFTMGLLIAIARRLVEGDKTTREGRFTGWAPLYHLGVEVTGKTLGIIGMGNIGKAVTKRAKAFDMKIIYNNSNRLDEAVERELGITYRSKEEVIQESDFLSLHVNYSPTLRHMIGAEQLRMMKPSAFLINAARGPLVDEAALLQALQDKTIAGAALDVYEFEPKVTPGLELLDNVILAPHLGNATVETREEMARIAATNIIAVLNGDKPHTCVNPQIYG